MEIQKLSDLDLDLGSTQGHISIQHAQFIHDYQRTRPCDSSLKQYGDMTL